MIYKKCQQLVNIFLCRCSYLLLTFLNFNTHCSLSNSLMNFITILKTLSLATFLSLHLLLDHAKMTPILIKTSMMCHHQSLFYIMELQCNIPLKKKLHDNPPPLLTMHVPCTNYKNLLSEKSRGF